MTVANEVTHVNDEAAAEPSWTPEAFESLSEDAVVDLLLRRMRKLVARGVDPGESLIAASRAHLPIP